MDEKPNCRCLFNHLMYCSSVKGTQNKGTSVHVGVSFGAEAITSRCNREPPLVANFEAPVAVLDAGT